uniref:Uncharacterized protein n=1 Tax=Rhizophora mucronata TaxID=61149 RepID=A0A2P2NPJ4_RHIMU
MEVASFFKGFWYCCDFWKPDIPNS